MAHMELEYFSGYFAVVLIDGDEYLIPEIYMESTDSVVDTVRGYGVRLSAPGYLDCTEWEVFETKAAAEERGRELLGDDYI